jgi:hypothetical protein
MFYSAKRLKTIPVGLQQWPTMPVMAAKQANVDKEMGQLPQQYETQIGERV